MPVVISFVMRRYEPSLSHMDVSKDRGTQNGWYWYLMEKPIKMDDLGVPLFSETPIYPRNLTVMIHDWKMKFPGLGLPICRDYVKFMGLARPRFLGGWCLWEDVNIVNMIN